MTTPLIQSIWIHTDVAIDVHQSITYYKNGFENGSKVVIYSTRTTKGNLGNNSSWTLLHRSGYFDVGTIFIFCVFFLIWVWIFFRFHSWIQCISRRKFRTKEIYEY